MFGHTHIYGRLVCWTQVLHSSFEMTNLSEVAKLKPPYRCGT
jgi:hypothetical protein